MSICKTALRTAAARPLYLFIYTVLISLMGVFIAKSIDVPAQGNVSYGRCEACVAVVDRDGSALSREFASYALGLVMFARYAAQLDAA